MFYVIILKERDILRKEGKRNYAWGVLALLLSTDTNSHRYQMGYPHLQQVLFCQHAS